MTDDPGKPPKGDTFLRKYVPALGRDVTRLGLATNYGLDEAGFRTAIDRGVNYFFWTAMRSSAATIVMKEAFRKDREKLVIATGPTVGWFAGSVRRALESSLRKLGTDYIDVFQLFWLGVGSAFRDPVVEELVKLRDEGKVRAIGVSIHDRVRAGRLAEESPLDLLMIRYNAAHPGAERDIFPHLARRKPAVVAYTATSWRKLLKRPSGWDGPLATPGDCYRFCLTSPHVDVVLTGPKNEKELVENLEALDKGALNSDEENQLRAFGKAVHG